MMSLLFSSFLLLTFAEHVITDPPHKQLYSIGFIRQIYNEDFSVYVLPNKDTAVNVSYPSDSDIISKHYDIKHGLLEEFAVPSRLQVEHNTGIQRRALHMEAPSPVGVVVFANNADFSDGFAAFPLTTGCACHHVPVSTQPYTYYPSNIVVSAFENSTTLHATLPPHVEKLIHKGRTFGAGETVMVELNQYDVFHIESLEYDLSGIDIKSDKPTSVYSGSLCGYIPVDERSPCSYLVEQMPPVSVWGTYFATVPLAERQGGDMFKVVAAFDQTKVRFHNMTFHLGAGEHRTLDIPSSAGIVSSTSPIVVTQFWKSLDPTPNFANPFMMLVPPVRNFLASYHIITPAHANNYDHYKSFVNIVVLTGEKDGILQNDTNINTSNWTELEFSLYSVLSFPISHGAWHFGHTRGVPFGLQVYGNVGAATYGYVGGWDMSDDTYSCEDSCLKKAVPKFQGDLHDNDIAEGSGGSDVAMDEPMPDNDNSSPTGSGSSYVAINKPRPGNNKTVSVVSPGSDVYMDQPKYNNDVPMPDNHNNHNNANVPKTKSRNSKSIGEGTDWKHTHIASNASASVDLNVDTCDKFKTVAISLGAALGAAIIAIVILLFLICRKYPEYIKLRRRRTAL